MRATLASPPAKRRNFPIANENAQRPIPHIERERPTRWSDVGVLVAVAPTLAMITLAASYYFGLR